MGQAGQARVQTLRAPLWVKNPSCRLELHAANAIMASRQCACANRPNVRTHCLTLALAQCRHLHSGRRPCKGRNSLRPNGLYTGAGYETGHDGCAAARRCPPSVPAFGDVEIRRSRDGEGRRQDAHGPPVRFNEYPLFGSRRLLRQKSSGNCASGRGGFLPGKPGGGIG